MTVNSAIEYLTQLYNGHSAIAERVDKQYLQNIHIQTNLDEYIPKWVGEGKDVVLTGNPGDGKTHLINVLHQNGELSKVYERDASQKTAEEILTCWNQQRKIGNPYVLAINHAPLRNLYTEAKGHDELADLSSIVSQEIDSFVVYDPLQKSKLGPIVVIDLSQRELLTEEIIKKLLTKLLALVKGFKCQHCPPSHCEGEHKCPIEYNLMALSNPDVVDRLVVVLGLVARRGFHATMRDLLGVLAYAITGGVSCQTRWEKRIDENGQQSPPHCDKYYYYNLFFSGRNQLFNALRETFDPADYAEPESDMKLWLGQISDGWSFFKPPIVEPGNLAELRRLKRRYFFEHSHNTEKLVRRMLSHTERGYHNLVNGKSDDFIQKQELVRKINMLYAPVRESMGQDYRDRLRLWNSHRYSTGQVPGYFAMRSVSVDALDIYRPHINPRFNSPQLGSVLKVHQDHIVLGMKHWKDNGPILRVDWEMYQALTAAEQGRPIDVQPSHLLRRLDLFLRKLGSKAGDVRSVERIEWSNHRLRKLAGIGVDRRIPDYRSY